MFREKKNVLMALSMSFMPFFAFAEGDGYVRLKKNNSHTSGFAGATWEPEVGVNDAKNHDYLVAGCTYYTCASELIEARSLTIGELGEGGEEGDYYAYYSAHYLGSGGLILAKGKLHLNASDVSIGGRVTFKSPKTAPVRLYSGKRDKTLTFTNDVHAASDCAILVHSGDTYPFHLKFTGETKDFLGDVVVTSRYDSAGAPLTTTFTLAGFATNFNGSVIIAKDSVFKAEVAAKVASLTVAESTKIGLTLGKTLTISSSLNRIGKEPFVLSLTGDDVTELTRFALLTIPANSEYDETDFKIERSDNDFCHYPVKMELSEDKTTKTLYAIVYPTVKLKKEDDNAFQYTDPLFGNSAVTNSAYWTDGKPVHNNAIYEVREITGATFLAFPYLENEPYIFPSLALCVKNKGALFLRSDMNVISNMYFHATSYDANIHTWYDREQTGSPDVTLKSQKFFLKGGLAINLRFSNTLRLVGPLEGPATSLIKIMSQSGTTSNCRGWGALDGDNTRYQGKISVTADNANNFDYFDFASLIVTAAENLGGPRSEFAYDALAINSYGQLDVRESMVLNEPSRGIFISGVGRILVAEEKELAIKQQLTVNGRLYKEGAGMLALGGDLRFLDASGAVTEAIPSDATNRTFYVTGGKVKPLTAYALDGLDVVFSNKTSKLDVGLALDLNTTDEELRTKGICNVKSPSPLAFLDDDAQKKIPLYLECSDETPAEEYSFAVMTVKADCVDVFNELNIVVPQSLAHLKLTTTKVANSEAGTVTLVANLKKYGFAISIR